MSRWLTVREAADAMRVDKQTVYRKIWAGELAWTNIGTPGKRARVRISPDAIKAYMDSRERSAA